MIYKGCDIYVCGRLTDCGPTYIALGDDFDTGNAPTLDTATITSYLKDLLDNVLFTVICTNNGNGDYFGTFTGDQTNTLTVGKTYAIETVVVIGSSEIDRRREEHVCAWRNYQNVD